MTGKKFLPALLALLILIMFFPFSSYCEASSSRRLVRVGLPDTKASTDSDAEDETVAYYKEYLQAVAEYANWDYVYVKADWNDCLEMIKNGELDVLLDVSKTDEREKYFDFSPESMGTEMCYLYGAADTKINYDDFTAFNGMTVGYEDGSSIVDALTEYGNDMGFTFKAKAYENGADVFSALADGEIDAAAMTSYYAPPTDSVILAKCSPSPVYIVTSKSDPSLKTELNTAMTRLFSYNPGFNTDLYKKHYEDIISKTTGYTTEEMEYLATSPVVNVLYETNWAPFEYDEKGTAKGITPDIIRAIGEDTGIQFNFVLSSSTQSVYQNMDGAKDSIMAVSYDYTWANDHDLFVTQPYVSGYVSRVTRSAYVTPKTVAVVSDGYLEYQIATEYPELQPVKYLTFSECLDAVAKGDADCVFLNYYQANYYRSMAAYEGFSYQPVSDISQSISLGVTKESNPLLLEILSKSLRHLSNNKVQSILSENSTRVEQFSLITLTRHYPMQMAVALGACGGVLCLIIFLSVTSSARKRKNLALETAKREAEEANRAKSEFLSRVSHDIRTPLNGIIGMTYLAGEQNVSPQARDYLAKIDTSSKFLLSLINDILDMSKAESNRMELKPEPYPKEEFETYVDAVIRPLIVERKQTLDFSVSLPNDLVPLMDKLRFNQIVFNILSNAVKYTPEGGKIRFTLRGDPLPDDKIKIQIEVRDNGIGMSEDFQKIIFEPFTQVRQNDLTTNRGTGLGMSITKKLVDLMGGTISVKSALNEGSTFFVELTVPSSSNQQVADLREATRAKQVNDAETLAGKRVLLCEDQPLNQEISKAILMERSVIVEVAENGKEAVTMFENAAPGYYAAILMDIRMPVMDGYEATKAIRALNRPDAATIPIIAMTADAFAEDTKKCREAGMNAHIAKPIDPSQVYRTLAELVE